MKVTKFAWDLLIFRSLSSKQMLISSSYLRPGRVKFPWNSAFKLAMVLSRTFEVNFSTIKSYKADMKHASWSEQSGCTVTIPTWRRARLLFQHGVGLARALSFGPSNVRICPHFHTFLCKYFTFLNACISVKTSPIDTKLGDFVNLSVLFLTT